MKEDDNYNEQHQHQHIRLIQLCNKKLESEPTCKKALLLRANVYIKLNQFKCAKDDLTLLLNLNDLLLASTVCYLMGVVYKKENKLNECVQWLTKSIELDTNNVNALFLRGAALNLLGKFNEAICDYSLALEKDSLKDTKTNVYKNIDKILDIGSKGSVSDDNNNSDSVSTYQNDMSMGGDKHGGEGSGSGNGSGNGSNDIDYEINKSLSYILKFENNFGCRDNDNTKFKGRNKMKWNTTKILTTKFNDNNNDNIINNKLNKVLNNNNNNEMYNNLITSHNLETEFTTKANVNTSLQHSFSDDDDDDDNDNNHHHDSTSIEQLYNKALYYRKQGKYTKAIELFTQVLLSYPNHFKSLFNKAYSLEKIHKYKESIQTYTQAIQIDNTYPYTFYNRGIVFDKLGLYDLSIIDFTKAIELYPNKAEFYYNRASSFKKATQYNEAIHDYTSYILYNKGTNIYNAVFNRATCYEKIKSYSNAINDFKECIAMNNTSNSCDSVLPLYHLGNIYYKNEMYDEAGNYFNQVICVNHKYAPAYHGLGLVNEKNKNYIIAIEYFTKAININSSSSVYYYNRACVYQHVGVISQAINDLKEAIKLDKDNLMFYENRAYLYAINKEYKLAIGDYDFILGKDKCNLIAKKNKDLCLEKLFQCD